MAESLKDKVSDAGHAIGEAAKSAGQSIAKGAKQAKEWVADKTGPARPFEEELGRDGARLEDGCGLVRLRVLNRIVPFLSRRSSDGTDL